MVERHDVIELMDCALVVAGKTSSLHAQQNKYIRG